MKTFLLGVLFAFGLVATVHAGNTVLTFANPITADVIPSGEASPVDGFAVFSGFYDEGDFRVRPNGGIWYVAGDLGDPVGHFYGETMPGLSQYLALTRISGRTILIGGEFLMKSLTVQSTDGREMIVSIAGQDEGGSLLYHYEISVPAGVTPVTLRLDTQLPTGAFLTPVSRVLIGTLGATGMRVLEVQAEPKKVGGGGKRGR